MVCLRSKSSNGVCSLFHCPSYCLLPLLFNINCDWPPPRGSSGRTRNYCGVQAALSGCKGWTVTDPAVVLPLPLRPVGVLPTLPAASTCIVAEGAFPQNRRSRAALQGWGAASALTDGVRMLSSLALRAASFFGMCLTLFPRVPAGEISRCPLAPLCSLWGCLPCPGATFHLPRRVPYTSQVSCFHSSPFSRSALGRTCAKTHVVQGPCFEKQWFTECIHFYF